MSHRAICSIHSDFTLIGTHVEPVGKTEGTRKRRKYSELEKYFPNSLFPFLKREFRKRGKDYRTPSPPRPCRS